MLWRTQREVNTDRLWGWRWGARQGKGLWDLSKLGSLCLQASDREGVGGRVDGREGLEESKQAV